MDKLTKNYREVELKEIYLHSVYNARIQISSGEGNKTKWISLTNPELVELKKLLTRGEIK